MSIQLNMTGMVRAIQQGQPVITDLQGTWHTESDFMRFIRWLLPLEPRELKVCRLFESKLSQLEATPVVFKNSKAMDRHEFQEWNRSVQAIKRAYLNHPSKKIQASLSSIDLHRVALRYRSEQLKTATSNPHLLKSLMDLAQQWKNGMELYQGNSLTPSQIRKMERTCQFPEFADLLLRDRNLQTHFFKWTFRYNNEPEVFIQYPATCLRLASYFLGQRIGRYGGKHLKIQKEIVEVDSEKKIVTLPFEIETSVRKLEVREIDILNEERQLTFRGGKVATIAEVYKNVMQKNDGDGVFEFFGDGGMKHWDAYKHGWWNAHEQKWESIDFSKDKWWEQFPVFETVTKRELETRFQLPTIRNGEFVFLAAATRESLQLDIDKSHGYAEIAIPNADGNYHIYPIGKFAEHFPIKIPEYLSFLCKTDTAKVAYPDESAFFSQRQHAYVPFVLTPEQGLEMMDLVKETLISSYSGNVVFQFAWENCAFMPQKWLESIVGMKRTGPLFYDDGIKAHPKNPFLGAIFGGIHKSPKWLQPKLLTLLEVALIPWRGIYVQENGKKVFKSVWNSPFTTTHKMYHPGALHLRIQDHLLQGIVTFGNDFEIMHSSMKKQNKTP